MNGRVEALQGLHWSYDLLSGKKPFYTAPTYKGCAVDGVGDFEERLKKAEEEIRNEGERV